MELKLLVAGIKNPLSFDGLCVLWMIVGADPRVRGCLERSPNGMAVVLKTTDDESCAFDPHPLRQFFNLSIG